MATGTTKQAFSHLMTPLTSLSNSNVKIPKLIYGTAWKKERTSELVFQALQSGFRGIDTAAQPRHYNESQVGEGIRNAISNGILKREDLYLQTKFTSPAGQDPNNMPYSLSSPLQEQIHASISSSLSNFTFPSSSTLTQIPEPYIDCLVLHSPLKTDEETLLAWSTLSTYIPSRKILSLGISNISLPLLRKIYNSVEIKPSVVQNRFYPDTEHDVELRRFCRENGIAYQCFWTLTGNPGLAESAVVGELGRRLEEKGVGERGDGRAIALYGLVMGLRGVCVLDGTTREKRMRGDLEGLEELGRLVGEGGEWSGEWEGWMGEFRKCIGGEDS